MINIFNTLDQASFSQILLFFTVVLLIINQIELKTKK